MDELEPRLAAAATESVALLEMEATRIAEALASLTDPSAELSQQILGRCDEEAELNEKRIRLASSGVSPATDAWRMVRACARQIETSTKVAATRKLAQQIVDVADQHLPSEDTPDTTADIRQIESRLETLRAERDSLTVRRDEVQASYFRTKEELNEQRLTIQTRLQQAQAAGREGSPWRMMGLEVEWPGMERLFAEVGLPPQLPGVAVRASLPIFAGAVQVGYASTATWSPLLKKYIALGHLQRPHYEAGTRVRLEVTVEHRRQNAPAKVVRLPFYEPEWKKK